MSEHWQARALEAESKFRMEQARVVELEAERGRLEWMLNFVAGKDAGLANKAAWAWKKHQESGEAGS